MIHMRASRHKENKKRMITTQQSDEVRRTNEVFGTWFRMTSSKRSKTVTRINCYRKEKEEKKGNNKNALSDKNNSLFVKWNPILIDTHLID